MKRKGGLRISLDHCQFELGIAEEIPCIEIMLFHDMIMLEKEMIIKE